MSVEANRPLIERVFAAMAQGDSRPLVEAMADDFTWTVMGRGSWARTYAGKASVLKDLFGQLRERIEGRIKLKPERVYGDGDTVVVEAVGDNVTRDGRRYDNRYCLVIRMAGGKMAALREYMDTELVAEVLGPV